MTTPISPVVDLTGKSILITGGGGGLGADMAALFTRLGARVLLADIAQDSAEAMAAKVGNGALGVRCDISDEESVAELADVARCEFGRIDALVNNAAHADLAGDLDLLGTDTSVWRRTVDVNLTGTMLVSRAIVPIMIAGGGGSIVTIVSRAGIAPPLSSRRLTYSTTKAGLIMLARHMAVAYGKKGVRSNSVAPGTIETERMLRDLSAERLTQSRANVLTPSLGRPEDISNMVAYLASDAGRFITGQTIQIDGGVLTGLHE
ncbi:SDR family NAD(P)-dependent oxidoreductase [Croceicoccus sp. BE223]|uniref:SDR family NAD(P)-dependent oxidoreductase n=1 Tax=Croceicoccus sp. BE223 TaxID=2817716 RepID=UPI00285A8C6E|nr:SDR family NAD(P)-dependent oxidoreductase [Croceicoccus sp. BE223]MDR7103671.1 NAD(P)-dependent dehydrogenase (short-subunit alcohol dehydrogenase family) [Croceicoccus sp. BE223]